MLMGLRYPDSHHYKSRKLANKLQHSINRNRQRKGIKNCTWNCNKGLVDNLGKATSKLGDVNYFILTNKLEVMAINEAGLHGKRSQTIHTTPMTTSNFHLELAIPGYKILLPDSRVHHNIARILIYVKSDINIELVRTQTFTTDLQLITFMARKGADARTVFSYFYREFTGGLS